ncbi:MAG: helix-turn-helix domain-containing protein [Bacillota bacterium]
MEEIGRRLQAARLAKGFTLQNVEDETRIRKKYIEALENGRTAVIPGEVYVKGFLRTYANHLGLDGEALVEEYKALTAAKESPVAEGAKEPGAAADASEEIPKAPDRPRPYAPRSAEAGEQPPRRPAVPRPWATDASTYMLRRALVGLAILVPLVGAGWWLFGLLTAEPEPPPPVTQQPAPVVKEPNPAPPPPAAEPPKPEVKMSGPTGENVAFQVSVSPVVVELQSFREGFPWMEATVDGKVVFSGKPTGPVKYEGREVSLRVGFMIGVDMVVNGQKFAEPLKGGPYTIKITGK